MLNGKFAKNEQFGISYYTAPAFDKTGIVRHAYSTRVGGVSNLTFDSLNLSILTSDELENVKENRQRFFQAVGINPDSLVGAHQVHKDSIYQVSIKHRGRGAYDPKTVIPATDALMTNEAGIALTAFFADCVPVFFLDPAKKVIAIAHAGWKGTVAKIAAKTAKAMQQTYGCAAEDILAAIGPSIGPCHYQVDMIVIDQVKEAFPDYWAELFVDSKDLDEINLNKNSRGQLADDY